MFNVRIKGGVLLLSVLTLQACVSTTPLTCGERPAMLKEEVVKTFKDSAGDFTRFLGSAQLAEATIGVADDIQDSYPNLAKDKVRLYSEYLFCDLLNTTEFLDNDAKKEMFKSIKPELEAW